ncbi:hypothetical protein O0Q50_19660 [Priestia aryabhattai]|uniref:Regulatory protein FmdB Zinc ribbon domain-containing protein n=1 Tax=Priestia aryabhattai TaxID=412384 RepID=A0AAX6NBV5_PRIAR|nr:hypothetical protein [Priestia aryabhattai]MDU9693393.1 hypothetical protein [Priestia aryabhattai]
MSDYQYEAECHGCFIIQPVNHIPLCKSCNNKKERDLVRTRSFDFSVLTSHLLSEEAKENVRKDIIFKYGSDLELFSDSTYRSLN